MVIKAKEWKWTENKILLKILKNISGKLIKNTSYIEYAQGLSLIKECGTNITQYSMFFSQRTLTMRVGMAKNQKPKI